MTTAVFAHRGASGYAPENTIEAFALAQQMGADGLEIDVQLTRDNELVVCHDERIDRVSDGIGRVVDQRLIDLKKLKFNRTHPEYGLTRLPTLRETLEFLAGTDMRLNIELKNSQIPYETMEEKCLDLLQKTNLLDRVIFSSFNHYSMVKMKAMDQSVRCGLLYGSWLVNPWDYAKNLGMDAIHPEYHEPLLVEDECENAHAAGLHVNPWTVDNDHEMKTLMLLGADCLITDFPDRAAAVRERLREAN